MSVVTSCAATAIANKVTAKAPAPEMANMPEAVRRKWFIIGPLGIICVTGRS